MNPRPKSGVHPFAWFTGERHGNVKLPGGWDTLPSAERREVHLAVHACVAFGPEVATYPLRNVGRALPVNPQWMTEAPSVPTKALPMNTKY